MKLLKIYIVVACCVLLTGTAAGYTIAFTVTPPETMPGGMVTITGTSSIPAGYADEAVLYREVPNYPPKDAGRYPFTITEGGNWGFTIDTTGFLPSTYKIQLSKSADYPYGSSAVLMQTFVVTAPPETPPSVATPAPTPMATTPPEEIPTLIIPPEPTTSPVSMATALAATGICALAFAYEFRRRDE
ncbi:hypothetical protein L0665_07140 [Methanogenium marinum]|uniref:Uncharacterized protein n=1 Tax=Methanogenium marinum TaxID=348610 RepID=A0A9Q4KVJ9_9EURY|nr:hypothetical protein [Methanogenium marinum]MDE4908385.1 hypothetical protein [Methanogenium marinum]